MLLLEYNVVKNLWEDEKLTFQPIRLCELSNYIINLQWELVEDSSLLMLPLKREVTLQPKERQIKQVICYLTIFF